MVLFSKVPVVIRSLRPVLLHEVAGAAALCLPVFVGQDCGATFFAHPGAIYIRTRIQRSADQDWAPSSSIPVLASLNHQHNRPHRQTHKGQTKGNLKILRFFAAFCLALLAQEKEGQNHGGQNHSFAVR